jgi:two-component system, OmpR family, response regulator
MKTRKAVNVLVVDDDDEVRTMVCAALTRADLSCDHASHGEAALEHLRDTDYAVVLLDLRMPTLDGAGVLREFQLWGRSNDRKPVILVVTAFADREAPLLPGDLVQAVIRKPFDLGELVAIVSGCVNARRGVAVLP